MLKEIVKYSGDFLVTSSHEKFTYDDLRARSLYYQSKFSGILNGSKVLLLSDYSFDAITIFMVLTNLDCHICPVTDFNQEELSVKRRLFDPDFVIDSRTGYKLETCGSYRIEDSLKLARVSLFSSGTTGEPKMMTQDLEAIIESHEVPRRQKNLKILVFLMFDHIGGLNTLISSVRKGMCLAITETRNPDSIINFISEARIQILPTTPTFLNLLLLSDVFLPEKLGSLKLITYGTEKMPQGTLSRLRALLPNTRLLQTFGTSETGIVKTVSKSSDSLFFKIMGADYKVVDNELYLKTGTQINKYEGVGASQNFTSDGWFKTGDLVEVDDDGYIRVVSRQNNIINVGGLKVFPDEIERIVYKLGFVLEANVYGKPNSIIGNMVCLRVIVDKNTDISWAKKEIKSLCKSSLEKYKVPQKISVTTKVEHTARFKKKL